jgi:hypothetical protein
MSQISPRHHNSILDLDEKDLKLNAERFWNRVDKTKGECWTWTPTRKIYDGHVPKLRIDGCSAPGFSLNGFRGKQVDVKRIAYELIEGRLQDGVSLTTSCGERLCVRPDHQRITIEGSDTIGHTIQVEPSIKTGKRFQDLTKEERIKEAEFHDRVVDWAIGQWRGDTFQRAPFDLIDGQGRFIEIKKAQVRENKRRHRSWEVICRLSLDQLKFARRYPLWLFIHARNQYVMLLLDETWIQVLGTHKIKRYNYNNHRYTPYISFSVTRLFLTQGQPFSLDENP